MTRVLYRFEDVLRSTFDEYDSVFSTPLVHVVLRKLPVLRETPKGVWIEECLGHERFVLSSARKKFACVTIQQAKQSFLARKRRQASLLKSQLWRAERAIELACSPDTMDLCQATVTTGGSE